MARYRKIDPRMWGDEKFRSLSKPLPNAQTLWQYLLTGPHTNSCPGLYHIGRAGMSESIGWSIASFIKAWKEIEEAKMGFADWESQLIWIPKAMKYNSPESPNVAAFWRESFEEMPECALRFQAKNEIETYLLDLGDAFLASWEAGSRRLARSIYHIRRKIPLEIADAVRKRDGDKCQHCGKKVNWNDRRGPDGATYDHLNTMVGHTEENIVVSCRSCNSKRGNTGKVIQKKDLGVDLGSNSGNDLGKDLGRDSSYPDNHSSSSSSNNSSSNKKDLKPLSGRKKLTTPNPHIKEFIDFYFQEFKYRFKMDPIINGGKDGALIRDLLVKVEFNELKILLISFLDSKDTFIQNSGYTIGAFKSQIQKLRIKPKPSMGKSMDAADDWLSMQEEIDDKTGQKKISYRPDKDQGEPSGDEPQQGRGNDKN